MNDTSNLGDHNVYTNPVAPYYLPSNYEDSEKIEENQIRKKFSQNLMAKIAAKVES